MNSRERVRLCLAHQEADCVPIDYWGTAEIDRRLQTRLGAASQEDVLQAFDVDFRYIEGPRYVGPPASVRANGQVEDHWGVPRIRVAFGDGDRKGAYQEVTDFPLADAQSVADLERYPKWPNPDWFDYECVREQVAAARATGKVVVFVGDRMNRAAQLKPAMYLRGVDQIFVDMALHPEMAEYLFHRIASFYCEYCRRTFEAAGDGLDIFMSGDDFGMQSGLMVSPEMWRRFIRPGFKAYVALAQSHGYWAAHHSCGSITPIIEDMIECGLDVLNPVQPGVRGMDRRELKQRFGDRLTFHGSVSIQHTLPFGTPAEIRAEVRERFETLAPGGGFIFCTAHNIQADTPVENVVALFEAYREFGAYALRE